MESAQSQLPVLIYDGNCGFCKRWIAVWRDMTGDSVHYAASQDIGKNYPQVPTHLYDESVVLVLPSGHFFKGAEAVFRALAFSKQLSWGKILFSMYEKLPGFAWVSEKGYRQVAQNRVFFSHLSYWLFGDEIRRPTYGITRWIFLRALGVLYLTSILSLKFQILGLVGSQGILRTDFSDSFIQTVCLVGIIVALIQIFIGHLISALEVVCLVGLWGIYFFLTQISQDFLWFQWDGLMLEMGFLGIFYAFQSNWIVLLLLRFLLFKVMFFSGYVKLASGDPHWRDLTALQYHFETQPLPTWVGWYLHHLPSVVLKFFSMVMFIVELVIPFLIFLPKRPRTWAFFIFLGFQIVIDLSGNYGFFGWQIVALCFLLLDDETWSKVVPKKWTRLCSRSGQKSQFKKGLVFFVAGMIVVLNLFPSSHLTSFFGSFRIVNQYGVFAVMTTERDEIIVEGSQDGKAWLEYGFKWKPDDLKKRPEFVEPHMPRLDWQMWFAALGTFEDNPWFGNFLVSLLQGSPSVLALIERNPFSKEPPRYIRALRYRYHFSSPSNRSERGEWWKRERIGEFSPEISLKAK